MPAILRVVAAVRGPVEAGRAMTEWRIVNPEVADQAVHYQEIDASSGIVPALAAYRPIAEAELLGALESLWPGQYVLGTAVPDQVSMRQARLALLQAGLLDQVAGVIAAIEDPLLRRATEIDWEFSADVQRQHPLVLAMANTFGLTAAQVDDLFRLAAGL